MAATITVLETENRPKFGWRLCVFGPFRLVDPLGTVIQLSTRKVEGLLAILAINREYGLGRDEIAEILWPGRPIDLQRANFRQALAQLRKAIGDGMVESSRVHCRLSTDLSLSCDFDDASQRDAAAFMPNQEGDWFERIRVECETSGSADSSRQSVVGNFRKTLVWFAGNDSRGLFEILRASASLVRGMQYADLLKLLDSAGSNPGTAGWAAYWRGSSEDDLQLCAKLLRLSFSEAKRENDSALASEVCLELGKVYCRTGAYDRAEDVLKMAEAISLETATKRSKANAMWLRGTILSHWSDREQGLEMLEKSEDFTEDVIERAIARSARAWYHASIGQLDAAHDLLADLNQQHSDLGHRRLDTVSGMTLGILSAYSEPRDRAIQKLEAVVGQCRAIKSTQFQVYGEELLSKLYLLDGDKTLADGCARSAQVGRSKTKMVLTPLEAKRVKALGP